MLGKRKLECSMDLKKIFSYTAPSSQPLTCVVRISEEWLHADSAVFNSFL
jgi:hypothetical protein